MKLNILVGFFCAFQTVAAFGSCPAESVMGQYIATGSSCPSLEYQELNVTSEQDESGKMTYWHRFSGERNWGIGVYADQIDHRVQKCSDEEGQRFIWRYIGPNSEIFLTYSKAAATLITGECSWTFKKVN